MMVMTTFWWRAVRACGWPRIPPPYGLLRRQPASHASTPRSTPPLSCATSHASAALAVWMSSSRRARCSFCRQGGFTRSRPEVARTVLCTWPSTIGTHLLINLLYFSFHTLSSFRLPTARTRLIRTVLPCHALSNLPWTLTPQVPPPHCAGPDRARCPVLQRLLATRLGSTRPAGCGHHRVCYDEGTTHNPGSNPSSNHLIATAATARAVPAKTTAVPFAPRCCGRARRHRSVSKAKSPRIVSLQQPAPPRSWTSNRLTVNDTQVSSCLQLLTIGHSVSSSGI